MTAIICPRTKYDCYNLSYDQILTATVKSVNLLNVNVIT